jgi:hypothetical protein
MNDLARGQIMEAALRERALAHAEACGRCAARLADERALSFSLRALASASETLEAPAQVETALRAAFRQQGSVRKPAPLLKVVPTRTRRLLPWATAAAAAIVTVFAIQAFSLRGGTSAPLQSAGNTFSLSSMTAVAFASGEKKPVIAPPQVESEAVQPARQALGARGGAVLASYSANKNRSSRRSREAASTAEPEAEIVTDFMPLTYGAALSPNEGGQLVRVELPRSALASLGLPMNVERADERVKADVLLGHDGLARAIRFVR